MDRGERRGDARGYSKGWLSNYHLAVRDEEFEWITRELQKYKLSESEYTVYLEPRLVVEVAFDEVQRSSHYASGYALRFARIKRIRIDKSAEDADTMERLRELYRKQFIYKGRKAKI